VRTGHRFSPAALPSYFTDSVVLPAAAVNPKTAAVTAATSFAILNETPDTINESFWLLFSKKEVLLFICDASQSLSGPAIERGA
jgi:hypothetical protein